MKKFLLLMLTIALCFTIVGCNDNKVDDENNNSVQNNVNNENNEQDEDIDDEENVSGEDIPLTYESDETSFTVNFNNQYDMTFEFENDRVSAYSTLYEFDTEAVATSFETETKKTQANDPKILNVIRNGNTVKVEYDPTDYAGLSRSQVEQMFDYLEE